MAIKKFIIHDKVVTYQFIENGQDLEVVIQGKRLVLSNKYVDPVTGTLFFMLDDKPYKVQVSTNNHDPKTWCVSFAHKKQPISVSKDQEHTQILPAVQAISSQTQAQNTQASSLKSPLAGRVSKVLVQAAQQVKKGQPLFLIESMKMENEIGAPRDAFIKTVFIAEGNVVQQNQILIDFECEGVADATAKNAHEQKTVPNR